MAGYSIGLYKYMRIDENLQKRADLLSSRASIIGEQNSDLHKVHNKFLAYGEFDRIGFECIKRFSRFRDISENGRTWIGDRQIHLIYSICRDERENEIFYQNGNFYEYDNNQAVQSDRLFIGITVLQFRFSVKETCKDMDGFLQVCRKNILSLVKTSGSEVKCTVMGTLGSFGLTILWLADQYTDVLELVTAIKDTSVGEPLNNNKSIFLSAYTIFAQNHKYGNAWENKIKKIKGRAVLNLTLKGGLNETVEAKLYELAKRGNKELFFHCAGEHDVMLQMNSSEIFSIFEKGNDLYYEDPFFESYLLQTNIHLCEVKMNNAESNGNELQKNNTDTNTDAKTGSILSSNFVVERIKPSLEKTIYEYRNLRRQFTVIYPSTAGMIDTLDLLFSDYISKISTASNEMWAEIFSHQFYCVLHCIMVFCKKRKQMDMPNQMMMNIINDLLSEFARQISHIAESNNLVLGTPVCQYQYSGQNNLTLYAYFGIIKNVLKFIYKNQKISSQDEIVPLIVPGSVPIIESILYIHYKNDTEESDIKENDSKIITINMPMVSLYNPICYYPYLYHEIFHYVVPQDRLTRNRLGGSIISMELLLSITKMAIQQQTGLQDAGQEKSLFDLIEVQFMPFIYNFILKHYDEYIDTVMIAFHPTGKKYSDINKSENRFTSRQYEKALFEKWLAWLVPGEEPELKNNLLYLYICDLYKQSNTIIKKVHLWYENNSTQAYTDIVRDCVIKFIESLDGIVGNAEPEAARDSFQNIITNRLSENVLNEAFMFADGLRESLPDLAMTALAHLDFFEYLILFTKIKCDLLIDKKVQQNDPQDIIRVGMIMDFCYSSDLDNEILACFKNSLN